MVFIVYVITSLYLKTTQMLILVKIGVGIMSKMLFFSFHYERRKLALTLENSPDPPLTLGSYGLSHDEIVEPFPQRARSILETPCRSIIQSSLSTQTRARKR